MSKSKKTSAKSQKAAARPRWRVWLRRLVLVGLGAFALGLLAFGVLYATIDIPDPNKDFQTQTTTVLYSDGETEIGSFANQDRKNVRLNKMSPLIREAVVAAEDRTFWENQGIDIKGIVRAVRSNARAGEVTAGGSTITQQYVKILYLNQERTYTRKVKEAILSLKIGNQLTKEEILEGYLNTIYFGNGAYGVEVAAETYFGTSAADLDERQAAFLATVINNPSYLDPYAPEPEERIKPRYEYVVDGMASQGVVTRSEATEMKQELPEFKEQTTSSRYGGTKGYLLDVTKKDLLRNGFSEEEVMGGGYRIVTTFDKDMQAAAVESVEAVRPNGLDELHPALVSVEPGTGAVKALYGGPDYVESQLNWATLKTQPGSTFKVFAVVAALQDGFDLDTRLDGRSPLEVGDDIIKNAGDSGGSSYGYVSLERATRSSVNTAFVDLTMQMEDGPQKILDAAELLGIPRSTVEQINPVIGVSLGYAPVAPIDMATAYATVAASGERHFWYVVEEVTNRDDGVEYRHAESSRQAIHKDVAADTIAALRGVVEGGTGSSGRTVCTSIGKTGTATAGAGRDVHTSSVWFVGSTPKLATAVMYNRGKGNEKLDGYLVPAYGGVYPAQTFKRFMDQVLDRGDCGQFPAPANIKSDKGETTRKPSPPPAPKPTEEPEPEPTEEPATEPTEEPATEPTPPTPPTIPPPPPSPPTP